MMYTNKNEMEFWLKELEKNVRKYEKIYDAVESVIITFWQLKLINEKTFWKIHTRILNIYSKIYEKKFEEIYYMNVYAK